MLPFFMNDRRLILKIKKAFVINTNAFFTVAERRGFEPLKPF